MARKSDLTPEQISDVWAMFKAKLVEDGKFDCIQVQPGSEGYVIDEIYHLVREVKQGKIRHLTRPHAKADRTMVCTITRECKNKAAYYVWFNDSAILPFLGIAGYRYACQSCEEKIPESDIAQIKPIIRGVEGEGHGDI